MALAPSYLQWAWRPGSEKGSRVCPAHPVGEATGVQVLISCVRFHLPEGETEAQGVSSASGKE